MSKIEEFDPRRLNVLAVGFRRQGESEEHSDTMLKELCSLVDTMGLNIVGEITVRLNTPNARTLIGSGKVQELVQLADSCEAGIIVFDEDITPSQQRNLERDTEYAVIDRCEVILDIFAQRATTREAVLQVQLARSEYDLPRLTRAWTHLSRQRGAANMKGEGERQIELDRRYIRDRIVVLQQELVKVRKQRATQRKQRLKRPVPTAAIVGYTNAGKSSLLNHITQAVVLADDKLFATLDPTTRKIELPSRQELLLTDTVGFIRNLPHGLVEAFKATLEETQIADFLIHVVDAADADAFEHIETTCKVLEEIGADHKRMLMVFNKMDKVESPSVRASIRNRYPDAIFTSVSESEGIEKLLQEMSEVLAEDLDEHQYIIPYDRFDIVSHLHSRCHILEEKYIDEGISINARSPRDMRGILEEYIQEDEHAQ